MAQIQVWLKNAWCVPRQQLLIVVVLLSSLSVLQYAPSLSNDFIWDGKETFLNDPSIRDFSYFPTYFSGGVAQHLEKQGAAFANLAYYRPAIRVLHLLESKAFGENPLGYHAVNIVLNLLVVLFAFLVVRELTHDAMLALVATAFFAVNPSHVEAVSWAYSDSYLLFSLFCLASLFLYLRKWLVWSLAMFSVALLSQESAILLPVILFFERFLLGAKRKLADFYCLIPFVVAAVLFLLMRSFAVGGLPLTGYEMLPWINAVTTIVATSVKIFFIPDAAIALYHNNPGMFDGVSTGQLFVYFCVFCLAGVAAWLWRNQRVWLFWFLWFFVWITVMFNVGEFAQFYFMDKILYLGSLGFCVLLAKGLLSINHRINIVLIVAVVVAHFSVSLWRESYYVDEKAYFEKAVEFAPDFPLLRYSVGMMYQSRGEYDRAEKEFLATVELDPNHSYSHNNIGNILYMRNDFDGAIGSWRQAIASDPTNPQPYYNIGATFERQGNLSQALNYYQEYVNRQPSPPADLLVRMRRLQSRLR